jgi:dolichol-phosphate mannosyltransferase
VRVSIIIPTDHEAENIDPLLSQIVASDVPFDEILFVDNASTDGTIAAIEAWADKLPVSWIGQDQAKPGLAAAILSGAKAATGDLLLIMDADLSHPPGRAKELLAPLFADEAEMVLGSRYISGGSTPGWPLWRRMLSRAGSAVAYPITGVHDSMCGFFAIKRSLLLHINPPVSGFKIAFETMVRASPPLRVREIPIAFRDRTRGRSKMSVTVALRFFARWISAVCQQPNESMGQKHPRNFASTYETLP